MENSTGVLKFPDGFLWGATTSSYQVEGGNTNNDWWQWEQIPGKIADGSRCGLACDHYHLYQSDFDIAKELGHNAHRFSLEWSRIEPKQGEWDEKAIAHYRNVLSALKQRQIAPLVTLFHFTLPVWSSEEGGFENPKIVHFFQRFATKVCAELGQNVDYWLTLNEPMVYIYMGYIVKKWPPGRNIRLKIIKVLQNMLRAHAQAYWAIHRTSQNFPDRKNPLVGLTKYVRIFQPYNKSSLLDRASARLKDYFFNHYILDIISTGSMKLPLGLGRALPEIKKTFDFIGLDYYTRELTGFNLSRPSQFFRESNLCREGDVSDSGWEIYPEGIYLSLIKLKKYGVPVIVTENGLADKEDKKRSRFIVDHLIQVHRAMEEGIDVRGYLHWSLMDNFEWQEGFLPRFGLAEVDYATQKRTLRPSAHIFARICKTNQITPYLLRDTL
jgi:beta-glucosidase